jgi:2-dehydropantoate 2-reductase
MRIVMIGAGAMGASFGAYLAEAGADVTLYDRDREHVAAIAERGLDFETPDGRRTVRLSATADTASVPSADIVVILVDSNATAAVAGIAARLLKPDGYVLTLQNGIGNVEALAAVVGIGRIVAGSTYNSAARLGPGHVRHSNRGETVIGEAAGGSSPRVEELAAIFRKAGLPIETSGNVMGHVWMKFVLNAAINPVAALTGMRPGEIVRNDAARRLLEALLDEILAVVKASGIGLPVADPRGEVLEHALLRYNRPSMLQHVEQGRPTEIDALNGALLKEAAALGLSCPVNETVVRAVKAIEARAIARQTAPAIDEAALERAARSGLDAFRKGGGR